MSSSPKPAGTSPPRRAARTTCPPGAIRGVITELGRVTVTLERYFADFTEPGMPAPARADLAAATLTVRRALYRAAASLRGAANAAGPAGPDAGHPASRHLAAAASLLAAGRDLLQTHFTTGADGIAYARSWQAPLITSAPVTAALAADLAGHARQLAPWASRLALPAHGDHVLPGRRASPCTRPATGCWSPEPQWKPPPAATRPPPLTAHCCTPSPPTPRHPGASPAAPRPSRNCATARRPPPNACATPAAASPPAPAGPPPATATSWRRDAQAAAITSHSSELLLRALASQATPLGASKEIIASLRDAADATARAQAAWRTVTDAWDTITTSRHHLLTPVAAEIGDLSAVDRAARLRHPAVDTRPRLPAPASKHPPISRPPTATSRTCWPPSTTPATR